MRAPSRTFTEEQLRVIETRAGEVYVLAAAGSGKTSTAVERTRRTTGPQTLLIAYNRNARADLVRQLSAAGVAAHASTVHSHCLRALRARYPRAPWLLPDRLVGVPGGLSAAEMVFAAFRKAQWPGEDWREVHEAYGSVREALAAGVEYPEALQRALQSQKPLPEAQAESYQHVFAAYEAVKRNRDGLDFSDMIAIVLACVDADPDFAARYLVGNAHHLVMDEGQDANEARWRLFDAFAAVMVPRGGSVLAVFDTRQSIYGFQGARPDLVEARLSRPHAHVLHLSTTFRNSPQVAALGNEITQDMGVPSTRARPGASEGPRPDVRGYLNLPREIEAVANRIVEGDPCTETDTVVLARTNSILAYVECGLVRRGIGFVRQDGSTSVWTTQPGKLLLAYVRTFERGAVGWDTLDIAAKPTRYVRKRDLVRLLKEHNGDVPLPVLHAEGTTPLRRLASDLREGVDAPTPRGRVDVALRFLLKALNRGARGRPKTVAVDDMRALYRALADELGRHPTADAAVRAFEMAQASAHRVQLSTIHGFKGLERRRVFVLGVSKDVLPHKKAWDAEEERRLLYVAVTRAESHCHISWSGVRSPLLLQLETADYDEG